MSTANKKSTANLQLAFDVGHSSIGWAILSARESKTDAMLPSVFKAGVVLFPADDCLASIRRLYRSQRRHIRSTRDRIKKLARLFRLMGVFSESDEKMRLHPPRKGRPLAHPAPWWRAAQILVAKDEGELKRVRLSWGELFDVLRWYAHNRGYDAHVPWARQSEGAQSDQAKAEGEKENRRQKKASELLKKYGRETIAETVFAYLFDEKETGRCDKDPLGVTTLPYFKRHFKAEECVFQRGKIVREVGRILDAHDAMLREKGMDAETMKRALIDDWEALPPQFRGTRGEQNEKIWLPRRYGLQEDVPGEKRKERSYGGLLFGQLIPRFENRIIGFCPVLFARLYQRYITSGFNEQEHAQLPPDARAKLPVQKPLPDAEARHHAMRAAKLPNKSCREFLQYRWAMLLADLSVKPKGGGAARLLSSAERIVLDQAMKTAGAFTGDELKDAIAAAAPGFEAANLDDLFTETEERKDELFVDAARNFVKRDEVAKEFFPLLSAQAQNHLLRRLNRGQTFRTSSVRERLVKHGDAAAFTKFDDKVKWLDDARRLKAAGGKPGRKGGKPKKNKKQPVPVAEYEWRAKLPSGKARYHRTILNEAIAEVLAGFDPDKKAWNPQQPDAGGDRKSKDGCLVQTAEMRLLSLGLRIASEDKEQSYREWLAEWRAKRSRIGQCANERNYQKHGDAFARRVYAARESERWLATQTNNHLVRQRLVLLSRLTEELIREFADGDPKRIGGVCIEVARDLLAFSGMRKQDIGSDSAGVMKAIKAQHFRVRAKLEKELKPAGYGHLITGRLIWKAKIADDLGWKCSYTGDTIFSDQLALGKMDVDHIIPRSQRLTDAMEACVITFKEINLKKGNRTAYQFVKEFEGKRIDGIGREIRPLAGYVAAVAALKTHYVKPSKGSEDEPADDADAGKSGDREINFMFLPGTDRFHPDYLRRKKRKKLLMIKKPPEESLGFTRRDLTITSHINRLSQTVLLRLLTHLGPEHFTSMPGTVTGSVRDLGGWQMLRALGEPEVCGERVMRTVKMFDRVTKLVLKDEKTGAELTKRVPKPKNEIRKATHLHHALDAAMLGVLSHVLPKDGKIWEYVALGDLTENEAADFRQRSEEVEKRRHPFPLYFQLAPIPETERDVSVQPPRVWRVVSTRNPAAKKNLSEFYQSLVHALAAKRVRQHQPADQMGMPTNETVYRVLTSLDGRDGVSQDARRLLKGKEDRLAQFRKQLTETVDKDRRKTLQAAIDALEKVIARMRDFKNCAWIVKRTRADSESGKQVLKKVKEYEDWREKNPLVPAAEDAPPGDDASPAEDAGADDEEDSAEGADGEGKKKRAPREPLLLRPYNAQTEKFIVTYDVVAKGRLVGLKNRKDGEDGKLQLLKAAKELTENYAVAVFRPKNGTAETVPWEDGEQIHALPFRRVWHEMKALRESFGNAEAEIYRKGSMISVSSGARAGVWRISSVKRTEAFGIVFDLSASDAIKLTKGNAPVKTLLKDGLKLIQCGLCGVDVLSRSPLCGIAPKPVED